MRGESLVPKAFVLINVESGFEDYVLKELRAVQGIDEAYFSYGVYDIITKVKAETMEQLKELVTNQVRTIPRVRSTLTLIIME
jgi:DNA-binding Lrp family transcriptional regulator